jgi:tetratricopeptide (TPR) repeat protein
MGADRQSTLTRRMAGKWQIPLLLLALVLFCATLIWLRPQPPAPPVERVVGHIRTMAAGHLLPEAEQLARHVLADSRYASDELAAVHAALAEVLFQQEERRDVHEGRRLVGILATYAQAEVLGHELGGDDHAHQGLISEWLHRPVSAAWHYRLALERPLQDPLEVRRRLLGLHLQDLPADQDWLDGQLEQLAAAAADRPEVLAWAAERRVERLLDEGRADQAQAFLEAHGAALRRCQLDLLADYLSARLHYRCARTEDAELILRSLCGRLVVRDDLHARATWLLGRVVLQDDGRPLQAMGFFEEVLTSHPDSPYAVAARLGMAEALTQLERHEEAQGFYRALVNQLSDRRAAELIDAAAVQASLNVLGQRLFDEGSPDTALAYLQIAADLLDPADAGRRVLILRELAAVKDGAASRWRRQALAAGSTEEARTFEERGRDLLRSAVADYLTLAGLDPDEDARAEALWQAAVLSDIAGDRARTIALLEDFLKQRPSSPDVPRVLQRLGQAYQADGQLQLAIERYQSCIRDYPRTGPAQDAIIPLADCFIMRGPDFSHLAEQTLLYIVEESPLQPAMFTPDSLLYRDALFRLGELYARDGRYEEAIVRLDEVVQRYPDDPRLARATFLLADAWRRSAAALDTAGTEPQDILRRPELAELKRQRLREARSGFDRVIHMLGRRPPGTLTPGQTLQLMLSTLYRADCAFDAGDYEAALAFYQEAARSHAGHPLSLAAHVQIVSCLEMLGRRREVGPAVRRAQYLAGRIDPQRFADGLTGRDAAGWQSLFAWLEETGKY